MRAHCHGAESTVKDYPTVCPNTSHKNVNRQLGDEEADFLKWAVILDPKQWPLGVDSYLTFGEK